MKFKDHGMTKGDMKFFTWFCQSLSVVPITVPTYIDIGGDFAPLEWQGKRVKPVKLNCRRDMCSGRFA